MLLDEIEVFLTGVRGGPTERVLATILFTDIVGFTDRAATLGDGPWRDLLDRHDQSVRIQLDRFRGHEVKTTGDGFVATFDSPGRAIESALAICEGLKHLGIETRAGIHTGQIEFAETTWLEWPFISVLGCQHLRIPVRCSSPAQYRRLWPVRVSNLQTVESTS